MGELRFAGVDWASEERPTCVVDERGRIVEGRRYRHNELGIRALCGRLVRLGVRLVGIERPDGLLIERLLDAGLAVIAVHPNQVKASRPRYRVAGGKSDGFDSFVLAELARTDSHRFRVLVPDGDQTKALRAMTRARDSLVRTRVGLANQLRDQLACFWPGASKVFCSVDSQIALALLKRYPKHPDGATFRSLFIAQDSWLCAATMLAEIGDCRDRYPSYRELAADAGQCAVAVESGKAERAQFRWACRHRLRQAFDVLVDASRRHNPWAADIYDRARPSTGRVGSAPGVGRARRDQGLHRVRRP